jgi:lipid-A-disaccharide synthase
MTGERIFLIAGELSGDLHGALLIQALKKKEPSLRFYALGGPAMRAEGAEIWFDLPSIAALGLGDVVRKYFLFRRIFYRTLRRLLDELKPDLVVLIDSPGFNIRFAKKLKKRLPVLYYISPQVWAWGGRRKKTIARFVDRMISILPFEPEVYRDTGLRCEFVGHPLVDLVKPSAPAPVLRKEWEVTGSPVIACLPGSREQEVRRILPVMIRTGTLLAERFPGLALLVAEAPHLDRKIYDGILRANHLPLIRICNRAYDVLEACDFALVTSGTATLETAIAARPFVILYKTAASTYFLGRRLIRIPYIGLVNVLAGRTIVPEFIQHAAEPEKIAAAVSALLLNAGARQEMMRELERVKHSLGEGGAADRAAESVLSLIFSPNPEAQTNRRPRP